MTTPPPFSRARENNKQPILEHLRNIFTAPATVLEIGTGTGQHAEYFATALPHLLWQPSDHPDNLWQCEQRLQEAALPNIAPPLGLDVGAAKWPLAEANAAFSANTAHIMAWPEVQAMFRGLARVLTAGAPFCLYGPFNYGGRFTSESNQAFDAHLRAQAAHMGIRDRDDLIHLAQEVGIALEADHPMPANNRLLVWRQARAH
ncbi:methylase [Kineobactrum sediminis]|uniref:Methylase n=1 Tax=Kineobactrum sediminis TaxID=1905677 RepID=A0A2N5Y125_9GAMM|nr:DUF938 domain-containing protein [Kineobactrum sediminis]PLW82095.1 methylase [Kineobactrum sediminis]